MTVHVRWPAKNSGAFVFGCTFLWSFLLCKQKKGQAVYIKTKKRKELKNILYWFEEKRNTTDNRGLPSSFIHVAIARPRAETISLLIPVLREPPY